MPTTFRDCENGLLLWEAFRVHLASCRDAEALELNRERGGTAYLNFLAEAYPEHELADPVDVIASAMRHLRAPDDPLAPLDGDLDDPPRAPKHKTGETARVFDPSAVAAARTAYDTTRKHVDEINEQIERNEKLNFHRCLRLGHYLATGFREPVKDRPEIIHPDLFDFLVVDFDNGTASGGGHKYCGLRIYMFNRCDPEVYERMLDQAISRDNEWPRIEPTADALDNLGQDLKKRGPGRPRKHDWDAFYREVIRIANTPDGLPDGPGELTKEMHTWWMATFGDGPDIRQIKEHVSQIYQYLRS